MAENIIEVQSSTFENEIKSAEPILLDFWAEWCGPCKRVAPILENVATELVGKLKVIKINVDNNQEIASRYQVMSIPTLIFLKDGNELERIVGAISKESLLSKIETTFSL